MEADSKSFVNGMNETSLRNEASTIHKEVENDPVSVEKELFDLVDLHSYICLREPSITRIRQLEYYLQKFPKIEEFGRLYCRLSLARFMQRVRHEFTLDTSSNSDVSNNMNQQKKVRCCSEISSNIWNEFDEKLISMRVLFFRKDSNSVLIPYNIEADDVRPIEEDLYEYLRNEEEDSRWINDSELHDEDYFRLEGDLKMIMYLTSFRKDLLETGKNEVVEWNDKHLYGILVRKLKKDENDNDVSPRERKLVSIIENFSVKSKSELNTQSFDVISSCFSVEDIQHRIEKLLLHWESVILTPPRLVTLGYYTTPSSSNHSSKENEGKDVITDDSTSNLKEKSLPHTTVKGNCKDDTVNARNSLKDTQQQSSDQLGKVGTSEKDIVAQPAASDSTRPYTALTSTTNSNNENNMESEIRNLKVLNQRLQNEFSVDELQEANEVAQRAQISLMNQMNDEASDNSVSQEVKKRTKKINRIAFENSDSDDHFQSACSQGSDCKDVVMPPVGDYYAGADGKVKRRRVPWSEIEKNAIKKGITRFGVGKWSDIKSYYPIPLKNRTTVQIKDCYRTMKKKGEL